MTYIQQVVKDLGRELPGLAPELLDLYSLLVLVKGDDTTLEDVHDARAIWTNRIRPAHHSIIPFEDLTTEVQELDRKYADAIISVS